MHRQSPPRYVEMEKKFEEEHIFPDLEQKKKKLAEIREMHRPIDHNEIVKHV